jgi:DNA-binding NarL/FixJ family response regulator
LEQWHNSSLRGEIMDKLMIRIHNTETDEVIDREMTDKEQADYIEGQRLNDIQKAEAEAKATARTSALAKLAALGLTESEIAAL